MSEILYANATLAQTGASDPNNAHGAPDGVYTTNTGNTSWSARYGMANPVDPLGSGATHTVTTRVRRDATGGSGTPSCAIELWDNGTLVTQLGALFDLGLVEGAQDIVRTFTTAQVSSGDNVQIRIVATGNGGGPNARTVQADAITLDAVTAGAAPEVFGSASLSGTGSVVAVGTVTEFGPLSEPLVVTTDGGVAEYLGSSILSGSATLTAAADSFSFFDGAALLSGDATLTATGSAGADAYVSMSGNATLTAAADSFSLVNGSALLSGDATLTAIGGAGADAYVSMSGNATLDATGSANSYAYLILSGDAALTATGSVGADASVIMSGDATLSATGSAQTPPRTIMIGSATLEASGMRITDSGAFLVRHVPLDYVDFDGLVEDILSFNLSATSDAQVIYESGLANIPRALSITSPIVFGQAIDSFDSFSVAISAVGGETQAIISYDDVSLSIASTAIPGTWDPSLTFWYEPETIENAFQISLGANTSPAIPAGVWVHLVYNGSWNIDVLSDGPEVLAAQQFKTTSGLLFPQEVQDLRDLARTGQIRRGVVDTSGITFGIDNAEGLSANWHIVSV